MNLGNLGIKPFVAVSLPLILTTMGATYLPARRASQYRSDAGSARRV